jgi:hypothetical protein
LKLKLDIEVLQHNYGSEDYLVMPRTKSTTFTKDARISSGKTILGGLGRSESKLARPTNDVVSTTPITAATIDKFTD